MTTGITDSEHTLLQAHEAAIVHARSIADTLHDIIDEQGFEELVEKMSTIRQTGFVAVDGFLTQNGVEGLTRSPLRNGDGKARKVATLFNVLSVLGTPMTEPSGIDTWSVLGATKGLLVPSEGVSYRTHADIGDSNTFFLNLYAPTQPQYSYELTTISGDIIKVPIITGGLVALNGFYITSANGTNYSIKHRVDTAGDAYDKRIRVMHIHDGRVATPN